MRYHIVIASGLLAVLATAYPCNAQTDVLPIKSTIPKASPKVRVLLEGFCPVSVVDDSSWVLGDDKYTTVHEKCGYRFANEQNKLQFENNPQKYAVALRGYDPVHLHQHKELVEGDRRYGLSSYKYGILLFANESNLQRFEHDEDSFPLRHNFDKQPVKSKPFVNSAHSLRPSSQPPKAPKSPIPKSLKSAFSPTLQVQTPDLIQSRLRRRWLFRRRAARR